MKTRVSMTCIIVLALGILTFSSIPQSFELLCDPRTVQQVFDVSDTIFEGSVVLKESIFNEDVLVTFEIENVFKGNPPNPITIHFSEGLYGYNFQEDKTYIIFAERTQTEYIIPLCIPVFYSFDTIVEGLESVSQESGEFGQMITYEIYENLTESEQKVLESLRAKEEVLKQKEHMMQENTRNVSLSLTIVGLTGAIAVGVIFWRKRK